jgi:phosphate-selective porin OprO/OprP
LFEVELAEGIAEVTDATVAWAPPGGFTMTVGQHNNFQSLEELSSDRFVSFMERAAFTDAFNFEYRLGVSATYTHGPLIAQAGAFTDNLLDIDEGDDQLSLDGRIVYAPRIGRTQLHFGGSLHWRDNGDLLARGTRTRYRQRPAIHATETRFIATPALAADRETDWGVEAAAIHGPLHVAAEAHWFQPHVTNAAANPTFFGGYVELGWFLTRESRGYRNGRWDRTRVRPGGTIEEGGFGAIQLNVRYDRLDLNSVGVTGGTQDGLLAGITWIPTDYVRVLLNYARLSYRDAAIPAAGGRRDYSVDTLGIRAQLDF